MLKSIVVSYTFTPLFVFIYQFQEKRRNKIDAWKPAIVAILSHPSPEFLYLCAIQLGKKT